MQSKRSYNISTLVISTFLVGTTLLPGGYLFDDNNHLLRNYLFVLLSITFFIYQIVTKRDFKLNLSFLSVSVIFFLAYEIAANMGTMNVRVLYLTCYVLLLCSLYNIRYNYTVLLWILILVCSVQIIICLMQCVGVMATHGSGLITGSFENPSGVSLLLSASMPFVYTKYKERRSVYIMLYILMAWITIFAIGSRAGILSVSIMTVIFLLRKHYVKSRLIMGMAIGTLVMLLLLLIAKSGSTAGRFLIMKLTLILGFENIWTGSGLWGYTSQYMSAQADYFGNNPESIYAVFADVPMHPLNEYLLLFVEGGLVGLVLLLVALSALGRIWTKDNVWCLCLFVIAVQSFFTYSMRYSFVWFLVILCISQLLCKSKPNRLLPFTLPLRLVSLAVCLCLTYFVYKDFCFEYRWSELINKVKTGRITDKELSGYKLLEKDWNGNPYFYYNYAAVLRQERLLKESNIMLCEYGRYVKDYYAVLMCADNYYDSGYYNIAARYYRRAHNMCPVRFVPLQGLLRSYHESGNLESAYKIANVIVDKDVKIKSYNVSLIKKEAEKYLRERKNEE